MTELELLQTRIRDCRRCVDSGHIPAARPLTEGSAGAPFFLVGQAPSRTDHESGRFYEGPAGRRLRGWLREAGFDDADFGTRVYAAALTKCFPGRLPGSSKDRAPSAAERAQCRPWLDAEFAAVDPKAVILFGGLAIRTFLSDAPLTELIGRAFDGDGRLWIPLPHASGASTWLNAPENRRLLDAAIERLREARLRYR